MVGTKEEGKTMAQPQQREPQPQAQSAQREQVRSTPRTVQFVVDRDHVVEAEVIREHQDGSLDLRGKFNQHGWKSVKETSLNPQTGQSAEFDVDAIDPNDAIVSRLRVRKADDESIKAKRFVPGTWF